MTTEKTTSEVLEQFESEDYSTDANIQSPHLHGLISKDAFIDWNHKGRNLYYHIFKPVEADIRAKEAAARSLCDAPWPDVDDQVERAKQHKCRDLLAICSNRREGWREARWPDLSDCIRQTVQMENMDNLDYDLEYIPAMDGWSIVFSEGSIIGQNKMRKFAEALLEHIEGHFKYHNWKWPTEKHG